MLSFNNLIIAIDPKECQRKIAEQRIGDNGFCEVFSDGYTVYDNGNRKTKFYLEKKEISYWSNTLCQKFTVDIESMPWYFAVTIMGEDRIEYRMSHPKTPTSDSDLITQDEDELPAPEWISCVDFGTPEGNYLKKEAYEVCNSILGDISDEEAETYRLYHGYKYTQKEIAEMLGVTQKAISCRISKAEDRLKKMKQKMDYFTY